jgi:hypothetical protein
MKTCKKYLDFLESHEAKDDSAAWQDIQAHAARCPDCSSAMKLRGEMFETLRELNDISYPDNLHQHIINEIYSSPAKSPEKPGIIELFVEKMLRPLELGFTVACVIMIVTLFSIENPPEPLQKAKLDKKISSRSEVVAAKQLSNIPADKKLEEVTEEEIQQFLTRLEKFQKSQPPKPSKPADAYYMPELRLVNDWE